MLVRDYKATWLDLTLQYAQVRPAPPCFSSRGVKHSLMCRRSVYPYPGIRDRVL